MHHGSKTNLLMYGKDREFTVNARRVAFHYDSDARRWRFYLDSSYDKVQTLTRRQGDIILAFLDLVNDSSNTKRVT